MSEWHSFGGSRHGGPTVRLSGGWQLPDSHLLPDAVVAFVDGELSVGAHERAAMHVASCRCCASEVAAQRQVRAAVHDSRVPAVPTDLLASLRSIPTTTAVPSALDNLAVSADGQLVTVQRADSAGSASESLGGSRLGSSSPLGSAALGAERKGSRRAVHGAGVVMSGLVLSALALVATADDAREVAGNPAAKAPGASNGVTNATFVGADPAPTSTAPPATPTSFLPSHDDQPRLVFPSFELSGLQR